MEKIGDVVMGIYIHLFELTIRFECWLDWDMFTQEELVIAEKIVILFTETFIKNVKRDNGMQFKLAKIHQLCHFVLQIREFGSASSITGCIGESNLKEKVKWPAERTQMQVATFEYQTAVNDIDSCLIHKACCEVVKKGDTILNK